MPQIVSPQTGNLAGGTDSSGNAMGAVIFDKPDTSGTEMLFHALQNNAKRMDDQQIAKQKAINARSLGLLDKIDINKNGVFEPDLPYFQEKTQELVNKRGDIYNRYGGDLTSKEAMKEVSDLEGEKAKLQQEAFISATDKDRYVKENQLYLKDLGEYDSSLYEKNNTEYLKAENLGKRASIQRLHERVPEMDELISGIVKKNYNKQLETDEMPKIGSSGMIIQKKTKQNFDDSQAKQEAQAITNGSYHNSKESIDRAWSNFKQIDPLVADNFVQQHIANGDNPIIAEQKAKTDWVEDNLRRKYQKKEYDIKFNGFDPMSKASASVWGHGQKQAQDASWIVGITQDVFNPSSTNYTVRNYVPQSQVGVTNAEPLKVEMFNGGQAIPMGKTKVPVRDKDGAPIINTATGVPVYQDVPNTATIFKKDGRIYMTTTESRELAKTTKNSKDEFIPIDDPTILLTTMANGYDPKGKLYGSAINIAQRNGIMDRNHQIKQFVPTQEETKIAEANRGQVVKTIDLKTGAIKGGAEAPKVETKGKIDATEQAKKDRINKIRVKAGLAPIK